MKILFMILMAAMTAGCATTTGSAGDMVAASSPAVTGTYTGSLWSKSVVCPVTTTITQHEGVLSGSYVFVTGTGEEVPGTLDSFRALGEDRITCTWHDRFGSGDLILDFSADGTTFAGRWRNSKHPEWHDWSGAR
ncbi:MAG TPA: hypothetical protein PKM88_12005 [bacterium]|nr:hypothetical protein [bacterium]